MCHGRRYARFLDVLKDRAARGRGSRYCLACRGFHLLPPRPTARQRREDEIARRKGYGRYCRLAA